MTEDRNFDDIAHKFAKNIYGSDKGEIRQVIVWEDLEQLLSQLDTQKVPLHVLDAGGGLAQVSQKIARLGHRVTLCDLSSEMLQLAEQDIANNGLLKQYRFVHSPVQTIQAHLDAPVDLVLFHAVMEWLAETQTSVAKFAGASQTGRHGVGDVLQLSRFGLQKRRVWQHSARARGYAAPQTV